MATRTTRGTGNTENTENAGSTGNTGNAGKAAGKRAGLAPLTRHLGLALVALLLVIGLSAVVDPFTNVRLATIGYLLLAVAGLTVLTGLTGQVSLGHGAFLFVGAYTVAILVVYVPALPFWLDLIIAAVVSGLAGVLTGAAAARLHGPYLAGATLALAVGLPAVTQRFPEFLGGSNGLGFTVNSIPAGLVGIVPSTRWQAWVVWATVLLAMVVLANITTGRFGRTLRAVRDDEVSAELSGIHVGRTKILAFLISAVCGGLAGGLQAFLLGTAAPGSFTPALSLTLLAAVVLGGVGSLWGALWGALALVYLQAWSEDAAHALDLGTDITNNLPLALYGLVLIGVVLAFPRGLHGLIVSLRNRVRGRGRAPGTAAAVLDGGVLDGGVLEAQPATGSPGPADGTEQDGTERDGTERGSTGQDSTGRGTTPGRNSSD